MKTLFVIAWEGDQEAVFEAMLTPELEQALEVARKALGETVTLEGSGDTCETLPLEAGTSLMDFLDAVDGAMVAPVTNDDFFARTGADGFDTFY